MCRWGAGSLNGRILVLNNFFFEKSYHYYYNNRKYSFNTVRYKKNSNKRCSKPGGLELIKNKEDDGTLIHNKKRVRELSS